MHTAIAATKIWLEQFVIALNLCPFAKAPFKLDKIRYTVFSGDNMEQFLHSIIAELTYLKEVPTDECETSLLIHPDILQKFLDYNDFQEVIDEILADMNLEGVIQVATFHPQYRFEGTSLRDAENYTNRSPYPMLHFLREESVEKAVETYPNIEDIPNKNIITMNNIGFIKAKQMLEKIKKHSNSVN